MITAFQTRANMACVKKKRAVTVVHARRDIGARLVTKVCIKCEVLLVHVVTVSVITSK